MNGQLSRNLIPQLRIRSFALVGTVLAIALLAAVPTAQRASRATAQSADERGVTTLTGTWVLPESLTQFVRGAFTERIVVLCDLTAFVRREPDLPLPAIQVIARLTPGADTADPRESFALSLPVAPVGALHNVGIGQTGDAGVQIYTIATWGTFVGDPFLSPYEYAGWPTVLGSIETAPGTNEVIGGRIVVWAPDVAQSFPSDFGFDGLLFTADDPVAPLPPGWTVVDLDARPFAQHRTATVEMPILNGDFGRDFSSLSYTAAFDALAAELRVRYPFTAVKGLNWDAIVAEVRPLVAQAEQNADPVAFDAALMRLALLTHDGHVSINPPAIPLLIERLGGGLGVTIGQTDDGAVIVTTVAEGLPAAEAGVVVGAEVVTWNGQPAETSLAATELVFAASSPHGTRLMQLGLLPRMPIGTTATISYLNPAVTDPTTVELTAVADEAGLGTLFEGRYDPMAMPVTATVLPSGIGYIRITTFGDDLTLMSHAWDWALTRLLEMGVPALIVDVRGNDGGHGQLGAYFAGSFTAEPFVRSQRFAADATGELIYGGDDTILPAPIQWDRPIAVLIDARCTSTCEEFTAAIAHDPTHLIVGTSPTGGVEANTRAWVLPEGLVFEVPIGMLRYPDGSLFVEGTGIAPTVRVPVTVETLLASDDLVLAAAEAALGA